MTTPQEARTHRRDLDALVAVASSDLRLLVARYDDPETLRDVLRDALPRMMAIYGAAAATLAADWYADLRDAYGAPGRYTPDTAELPDIGRTDALAGWAVGPMFSDTPDKATTFSKLDGGFQRIVADADRQTITASSVNDRAARGWTRVTSGGCPFCESRAGVTITSDVVFPSHDHCSCVAAPQF